MCRNGGSHDSKYFINPGPHDTSVLHLYHSYRSKMVWNEPHDTSVITCRRSIGVLHGHNIDDRLIPYLCTSGFYGGAVRLGFFHLDHHLIIALIEKWRLEIYTFMLRHRECTLILQDIYGIDIWIAHWRQHCYWVCRPVMAIIMLRFVRDGPELGCNEGQFICIYLVEG